MVCGAGVRLLRTDLLSATGRLGGASGCRAFVSTTCLHPLRGTPLAQPTGMQGVRLVVPNPSPLCTSV